jgi:hypothetical protein
VGLTAAAGAGGLVVGLSSSSAAVTVPVSVTVAGGASTATFTATASTVTTPTTVTLTAAAGGRTQTFAIGLTPPSSYQVDLTWAAPSSSADPVAGYIVYRATGTGNYEPLFTTPVTALAFNDLNVSAGTTYDYEVTSVDAAGNESVPSSVYTAAIP